MGEIADMHLDGTLCESCGVYMGEPVGYPVSCDDCHAEEAKRDIEAEIGRGETNGRSH